MQAIKTIDLIKRYKNITAVDKLNLEIRQGELFSLLGINGAGKTTTITYGGKEYTTHLAGNHQIENTVNAIEWAKVLGISQESIKQGIFNTRMIARMEIIDENPLVIRDGGHNEGCAEALYNFLKKYNVKNINMLIGLMADKDVEGYVQKIAPLCKSIVTVTPSNPRALNGDKLKEIAKLNFKNTDKI